MRFLFTGLCSLLLMAVLPPKLLACSCTTLPLEKRVLQNVIFIGEALQYDKQEEYRFTVLESFTRHPIERQTIEATNGPCGGIQYKPGIRYLLYGSRWSSALYEVGSCSGSRAADDATAEIDYVRTWTRTHP